MEARVNTTTMQTPAGPLTIVASDTGVVRAAGFTDDVGQLLELLPPSRRQAPARRADLGRLTDAVGSYLAGDLDALDGIPVEPGGDDRSGFIVHAWHTLRQVGAGEVVTYSELAARAGRPRAVRAAANACARNAVALFVPCHRVRRSDGGLGGYRWGTAVKQWLLDHERAR
jgi:methylated-DNA-[protein]-cysteine S-methyltransferase